MYGTEMILDLHGCNIHRFTREALTQFFRALCDDILKMERADLHFWDYEDEEEKNAAPAHLAGTSAVQFITTSNVTIHTLDKMGSVYLNIFSCAQFNPETVTLFCINFFTARNHKATIIERTAPC